jgi:hypothetical protein
MGANHQGFGGANRLKRKTLLNFRCNDLPS